MVIDPHQYVKTQENTQILLMRHPETVANAQKRYLGSQNMPLSTLGEQQCAWAIEGLVAYQPAAIVSSPLERCLAIAVPAAERLGIELEIDARLGEMGFGVLEGLTYQEAVEQKLSFPWGETAPLWPVEGGERIEDFAARLLLATRSLEKRRGKTAVVAHGGVIRGIASYWLHMPLEFIWTIAVRNVESALFCNDNEGTVYLDRFGIKPEWLTANL
ncbi:MAG: histidine phosphatase family protein [Coriobacteriales bacterium]|jgi:broad specificity phosphatase PhoE|nr:histidine phosphatase family protein [Coriobacteriales bacterium]